MEYEQFWSGLWVATAVIIANIWLVAGDYTGFLMWMVFGMIIIVIDAVRVRRKIAYIQRRMRMIEHLEKQGFKEVKPKKKK